MAEVEFGDLKFSGGKLLLIIPFIGSLGGALWGGFELYQRLLTAEEAITNYVSPDFSAYDEALAVLTEQQKTNARLLDSFETMLEQEIAVLEQQIDRLEVDITAAEQVARGADDVVAETARELRDDVYSLEARVNDALREVDNDLRDIRDEIDEEIQRILDNPLNNDE